MEIFSKYPKWIKKNIVRETRIEKAEPLVAFPLVIYMT